MSRALVVLGASGHAKMVIEAARSQGSYEPTVCLSATTVNQSHLLGVPIRLETRALLTELQHAGYWAIVAIGDNQIRRKLQDQLDLVGFPVATIVAKGAWLSPSASLGAGSVLMPNSTVGAESQVGRGVIVNTNASVDHDCEIADFAHIAPGGHLAGNVIVESEVFCGVGTSVIPHKRIGACATVGAGAVVVRDVPPGECWVGCPARPLQLLRRLAS